MKKNILLVTICSISLLVGVTSCGLWPNIGDVVIDVNISSIKEGINNLKNATNFTLDVRNTLLGDRGSIYYTYKSYYSSLIKTGFIEEEKGIYPFSVDTNNISRGGELLTDNEGELIHGLFEQELIPTFKAFDVSKFGEEVNKTVSITDTVNRAAFLELMNEETSQVTSVTNFVVTYDRYNINSLVFKMDLKDNEYIEAKVTDVNETKISVINQYLSNGGSYYTPSADFTKTRELFSKNNFTRNIYDSASGDKIGDELYTQKYYTNIFDIEKYPAGVINSNFYFSADNDTLHVTYPNNPNQEPDSGVLKGIYMGSITYDVEANKPDYFLPIVSRPINSETTNLPLVMRYPSYLGVFQKLEYYTFNEEENVYFSDSLALAYNMYLMFYLDYSDYDVEFVGSGFSYDLKENDKDCVVTFKLFMKLNGLYVYDSFEFTNFNNTKLDMLEKFTTEWTYEDIR